MKGFKLIVLALILLLGYTAHAQPAAKASTITNTATKADTAVKKPVKYRAPAWGPAGYASVRYYYLPDIWAYYDVKNRMFIYYYYTGKVWVRHHYLPRRFRDYDLFSGYKVPMSDYKGTTPYKDYMKHKAMYARGYHGKKPQKTVGKRPANYHSDTKKAANGQTSVVKTTTTTPAAK